MKTLLYQLKNIRRDKMCIMTFFLPVIVGLSINLISYESISSINEAAFAVIKEEFKGEEFKWLKSNGEVIECDNMEALEQEVNDPATQIIGVMKTDTGIRTVCSGDELNIYRVIADTLPKLFDNRELSASYPKTIISETEQNDGLKSLLIVITVAAAIFMGCTFNAMNIINEKEEGIEFINMIMPIANKDYIIQKIALGFIGSVLSGILTILVCVNIKSLNIIPFTAIIVLSAFMTAVIGLIIGQLSRGLMTGIVYIKIIMLLSFAIPVFFYLAIPNDSILYYFSYLFPSSAAFYGLMNTISGELKGALICILVLAAHCVLWFYAYIVLRKNKIFANL